MPTIDLGKVVGEGGASENLITSMTAEAFEALTTEQKAALYAQGVRVVAVDGASYLLDAEGVEVLLGLPVGGTAVDSEKLDGKPAEDFVDTSKVVNNFAVTEEGFVADARTVKLLHENQTPVFLQGSYGIRLYTIGMICYLIWVYSGSITADGITLPYNIKPINGHIFTGKANVNGVDLWTVPFLINEDGVVTARANDNNSSIVCSWVNVRTVFVLKDPVVVE